MKEKDTNVELLRIIACLMVVGCHVRPFLISEGMVMEGATLVQAFCAPAVTIFFMIAGFFTPRSGSILKVWKRCITGIVIPSLIFVIVTDLLEGWISGRSGMIQSILSTDIFLLFRNIAAGILSFNAQRFGTYTSHLWYIFSYIQLMLWFPVMKAFLNHSRKWAIVLFVFLSFYRLLIIDITKLYTIPFSIYLPTLLPAEVTCFAAGYLVYDMKDSYSRKRGLLPILAAGFLLLTLDTYFLQLRLYDVLIPSYEDPWQLNYESPYFLSWTCGLSELAALFISMLVLSIPLASEPVKKALGFLGRLTFPIYLIHFPLVTRFDQWGIQARLLAVFGGSGAGVIVYSLIMTLLLFSVSALISYLIILCMDRLGRTLKRSA